MVDIFWAGEGRYLGHLTTTFNSSIDAVRWREGKDYFDVVDVIIHLSLLCINPNSLGVCVASGGIEGALFSFLQGRTCEEGLRQHSTTTTWRRL